MIYYYAFAYMVAGACLLITGLGIAFSIFAKSIDRWNKRYLIGLFSLQLVCVSLCLIDAFIYEDPDFLALDKATNFLIFFSLAALLAMPTFFLNHFAGENQRKTPLSIAVLILLVLYLGMVIAAQFTDIFYSITAEEGFIRGSLFPLLLSPLVIMILIDIVAVFLRKKKLPHGFFIAFLVHLPLMAVTILVHMFFYFEVAVIFAVGIWALTSLILVEQGNMRQLVRQQQEIASQRASIMVLEMRPHFIYNTMTSIYYLCDQDPSKAKQVTLDFTTYLRKNFAAIASEDTIPFVDELEHTRAYLAVEQAQFEDSLFVTFDTPHTLFRLPPLTLQPIVENAVKHGMRNSNAPIHIYVSTRKVDNKSEILVEDDGPGFKPVDDNEPHIALNNIRARLELLGGEMSIAPRQGGGTSVKVTLPFQKEKADS